MSPLARATLCSSSLPRHWSPIDPRHALVDQVRVGEAPVGLGLVAYGRGIVVADSNRFSAPGKTANLAFVNLGDSGRLQLVGYLRSGIFPRDMAVSPNGHTVLVSNFQSGQLEIVDVPDSL